MASPLQLQTFADLYTAIREALGVQAADTISLNKIKRLVNMYYLDEVVPFKRWRWLKKTLQVVQAAYYNVGTASVTPQSATVTLSIAPSVGLGSFQNYCFSIDSSNAIYTVLSHTAGSATLTLSLAFQEALNATAPFKIWRDRVDLPTTAKETLEITHPQMGVPMEAKGVQDFTKVQTAAPKGQGFPRTYTTDTFFDPSGLISESDRYRQVRIYPAISPNPTTLTIDYIEEAVALVNDTDEPIIPLEDRVVLYYGGLALGWSNILRNEDMHDRWMAKANAKLARMAGEIEDGVDSPKLTPSSGYVNSQRSAGLRRRRLGWGIGGDTPVSIPTYLQNVTINGGTLTGNLNVNPGVLIDGIDLSTLSGALTPLTTILSDNASSQIAVQFPLASTDVVEMDYSLTRGLTILEAGTLWMAGLAAGSSLSQWLGPTIGSSGVTFTTTISNGNLQLLYSSTSTGTPIKMTYRAFKWLG